MTAPALCPHCREEMLTLISRWARRQVNRRRALRVPTRTVAIYFCGAVVAADYEIRADSLNSSTAKLNGAQWRARLVKSCHIQNP